MKQIVLLLISTFLLNCNKPNKKENRNAESTEKFGEELIKNEFLIYADSSKLDSLEYELKKSFNIYHEEIYRITDIDAEELAEFNFNHFLPGLNKILTKRGFGLAARKLNDNENSYDALINGDTIQLYTKDEIDNGTFWDSAPRNFFRKLNDILKSKNSGERFYLLYGGNDLHTMLLTEKQFSVIAEYYKNEPSEIPYKP